MKTGIKILSFLMLVSLILTSCENKTAVRDRTAVTYVTNHFNHSNYEEYLELKDVEVVDERINYNEVYDMEFHVLTVNTTLDIKESFVVAKHRLANFLEIDRSWKAERQRRIDEAENEEEIQKIKEYYLEHLFDKGVHTVPIRVELTWNETEDRWMVLFMQL